MCKSLRAGGRGVDREAVKCAGGGWSWAYTVVDGEIICIFWFPQGYVCQGTEGLSFCMEGVVGNIKGHGGQQWAL